MMIGCSWSLGRFRLLTMVNACCLLRHSIAHYRRICNAKSSGSETIRNSYASTSSNAPRRELAHCDIE